MKFVCATVLAGIGGAANAALVDDYQFTFLYQSGQLELQPDCSYFCDPTSSFELVFFVQTRDLDDLRGHRLEFDPTRRGSGFPYFDVETGDLDDFGSASISFAEDLTLATLEFSLNREEPAASYWGDLTRAGSYFEPDTVYQGSDPTVQLTKYSHQLCDDDIGYCIDPPAAVVPLPAAGGLLLSGLFGLWAARSRRS